MMSSIQYIKHVCDRCGTSVTKDTGSDPLSYSSYLADWQHLKLGQTGASLDLCSDCNVELFEFLAKKNARGMEEACFNKKEVL